MKKVLILTSSPWDDTINTGNTLSNFFSNYERDKLCHVYLTNGMPNNPINCLSWNVSEKDVVRGILSKDIKGNIYIPSEENNINNVISEKKLSQSFQHYRFIVLLWIRELIWSIFLRKSSSLKKFVCDYNPDIIFAPLGSKWYTNKLLLKIKGITNSKVVGFVADDLYSLKQFSISPLYWIDRLISRKWLKRSISICDSLYVMSQKQKDEYDKTFNINSKILYKSDVFKKEIKYFPKNEVIKFVYTGNLIYGRWKTIVKIGRIMDKFNTGSEKCRLDVYSQTQVTPIMKFKIDQCKSINFCGMVPASEVKRKQEEADVLLHTEAFELKSKLLTRLSFSTKLVDYFKSARCIFAIGWEEAASINYLINNDAAIVATNEKEIEEKIKIIVDNPNIIEEYAQKAWDCGNSNHQIDIIQKGLYEELYIMVENN